MDSGSVGSKPTWIHANARLAEAGYQDPALGWVGVRAQQDSSGVHATVVPVSPGAAQALGTHMAGLTTYLAEHGTSVSTLSVASPEVTSTNLAMDQGGQSQSGQHHGQNASNDPGDRTTTTASDTNAVASDRESSKGIAPPSVGLGGSGGTYISVMA